MKIRRIFNFIVTLTFKFFIISRKPDKRFIRFDFASSLFISKLNSLPRYLNDDPSSSAGIFESFIVRFGRYCECGLLPVSAFRMTHICRFVSAFPTTCTTRRSGWSEFVRIWRHSLWWQYRQRTESHDEEYGSTFGPTYIRGAWTWVVIMCASEDWNTDWIGVESWDHPAIHHDPLEWNECSIYLQRRISSNQCIYLGRFLLFRPEHDDISGKRKSSRGWPHRRHF